MRIIYTQFTRTYTVVERKELPTRVSSGLHCATSQTEVFKRLERVYGAGLWNKQ